MKNGLFISFIYRDCSCYLAASDLDLCLILIFLLLVLVFVKPVDDILVATMNEGSSTLHKGTAGCQKQNLRLYFFIILSFLC